MLYRQTIFHNVISQLGIGFVLLLALPTHAEDNSVEFEHAISTQAREMMGEREKRTRHSHIDRQLKKERRRIRAYITEAYQFYPEVPRGTLEALAYTGSRWSFQRPHGKHEGHHERPQPIGVMGLYHDQDHFQNTLNDAADALGVLPEEVRNDMRTHIIATAALVSVLMERHNIFDASIEDMVPVFEHFSGIKTLGPVASNLNQYAINSHVYDVLLSVDKGVDDGGISVPTKRVQWQRVFNEETLIQLNAPFLHMDVEKDHIEVPGYDFDVKTEKYHQVPSDQSTAQDLDNISILSTDYGPALWVASPYHGTRTANISAVTVHTTQGSYAGTISWFQNNPYSVSAHYVIRSSDGQITQMVRESRRAHHVGIHNSSTLGIEHEGFVSNPAYYTTAMYNASANLVKHFCQRYSIDCTSAYNGPASSTVQVLPTSVQIKGHQHFSSQTHTDPGIHWDWSRYYTLINGGSGGGGSANDILLDSFESNEGHFTHTPAYSGSTQGISSSSTAQRTSAIKRFGSYSEQIKLVDDPNSSANWQVRFLSGGGSPSNNVSLSKPGGRVGFWVYSGGSGLSAAIGVDDNDGSERSVSKSIPANQWTYLEWWLDDSSQWNPWVGGNGVLSSTVSLDAIWFYRAQTSYNVYVYIDDVQYRFEG